MSTLIYSKWALPMAQDVRAASKSVALSALSVHLPVTTLGSDYGLLWCEIRMALLRGVAVTVFMPSPTKVHLATVQNVTHGRALAALGVRVHFVMCGRLLHAKTCLIDGRVAWVGSGNFTRMASDSNYELYMRSSSPLVAAEVAAFHAALPSAGI